MFKISVKFDDGKIKKYNDKFLKAVDKGLNDLADFVGTKSDAILRGESLGGVERPAHPGSFDTGMLAKSLVVDKEKEFEKVVAYEAPHSIFIEFGTKPHWSPIKPVYDWVYRQRSVLGISPKTKVKAKSDRMRAVMPEYFKEIMEPTMAIIQTIAKDGMDEKPFLRPSINLAKIEANHIMRKRIEKVDV